MDSIVLKCVRAGRIVQYCGVVQSRTVQPSVYIAHTMKQYAIARYPHENSTHQRCRCNPHSPISKYNNWYSSIVVLDVRSWLLCARVQSMKVLHQRAPDYSVQSQGWTPGLSHPCKG